MTGPEHYREAEKLLTLAVEERANWREHKARVRLAQVHASLAVAAALAGLDASEGPGGGSATGRTVEDANEWAKAAAPLVPTDGAA